jgi:hypothetical protein
MGDGASGQGESARLRTARSAADAELFIDEVKEGLSKHGIGLAIRTILAADVVAPSCARTNARAFFRRRFANWKEAQGA